MFFYVFYLQINVFKFIYALYWTYKSLSATLIWTLNFRLTWGYSLLYLPT